LTKNKENNDETVEEGRIRNK